MKFSCRIRNRNSLFKVGSGAEKNHCGYTALLRRKDPEQKMESGSGMTFLKGSDADSKLIRKVGFRSGKIRKIGFGIHFSGWETKLIGDAQQGWCLAQRGLDD
jgi:hypothetical protein